MLPKASVYFILYASVSVFVVGVVVFVASSVDTLMSVLVVLLLLFFYQFLQFSCEIHFSFHAESTIETQQKANTR